MAHNKRSDMRLVRLAYQPPASSTFLSEQTSHQQPANSTFLSEQTSTSHQPNEQADSIYLTKTDKLAGACSETSTSEELREPIKTSLYTKSYRVIYSSSKI
jgi:hypothetical protein